MSDQYIGEIRVFGCNYAPSGWAQCNGQTLPIQQNTALFSLLGTNYGGNGQTTFALPDLQGRAALDQDQGNQYFVGQSSGVAAVTLLQNQMPKHNHTALGVLTSSNSNPANLTWANSDDIPAPSYFASDLGTAKVMNPNALAVTGSNLPHNNLMPYQVLNFCIALRGIFPQRQ